jgi:hypothetical protein
MSEPMSHARANARPKRGSRLPAALNLVLEFAFFFAIAMIAKQVLAASLSTPYPNLLWLPVVVLTLQHGLAVGLTAALVAAALQFSGGVPPALLSEDMYTYIGRLAAEPVAWTCVALVIGHMRSRQIANVADLQARLAECSGRCETVADLCVELRSCNQRLERQIATADHPSNAEVVQALSDLQHASWEDFSQCLTRFVVLMTGCPDFSIHLYRDGCLKLAIRSADEHRLAADAAIAHEDPLFAAIANERRILSAARPADVALLAGRAVMAGPLMRSKAPDRLVGMLALCNVSLDDLPQDIECRFSVTCSELSRLGGRIMLLDGWQAAAADKLNGQRPVETGCDAALSTGEERLSLTLQ